MLGVFIALASPSIPAENIEILCFSFPTARVFSREDGGGRALKIQWPTVVHATAYVVELWEENSQMPERFHSCQAAKNGRDGKVQLQNMRMNETAWFIRGCRYMAGVFSDSPFASFWSFCCALLYRQTMLCVTSSPDFSRASAGMTYNPLQVSLAQADAKPAVPSTRSQ